MELRGREQDSEENRRARPGAIHCDTSPNGLGYPGAAWNGASVFLFPEGRMNLPVISSQTQLCIWMDLRFVEEEDSCGRIGRDNRDLQAPPPLHSQRGWCRFPHPGPARLRRSTRHKPVWSASDPLNAYESQQQLQSNDSYWSFGGTANSSSLYQFYESANQLHIGIAASSTGEWSGFYAVTPATNASLVHANSNGIDGQGLRLL